MRRVSDSKLLSLRCGGNPFQWATRKLPVVPVAVYPTPELARSAPGRRWQIDSPWLTPEMLSDAPGMAIISLLASGQLSNYQSLRKYAQVPSREDMQAKSLFY